MDKITLNTLGQILTVIGYIIFGISRYLKTKKNILIVDNISRIIKITSFICLGSFNAIENALFACVRNIVGQVTDKSTKRNKIIAAIILEIALLIMYGLSFDGFSTVLITICATCNIIGATLLNEQGLRLAGIIAGLFYSVFQLTINNTAGFICELICIVVVFISWLKYHKNNTVEQIDEH